MRNTISKFLDLHMGEENPKIVLEDVTSNVSFRGANLWILASAILIASVGLNVNSTAVIIGAMLISPLMGPIVGAGFALATFNFGLLKKSIKNLIIATIVSLAVSSLYFYLSPFKEVQSELLARTSPNIYDVLIAFFGGVVGAVSITRVEKGNPIPGVAIATALMPPLCTAGFGIATGNLSFVAGAFYLYTINCFFICIATFLIIKFLKYQAVANTDKTLEKRIRYGISVLIIIMIVPSCYLAYDLLNEKKYTQNVEKFINSEFTKNGYTIIYKKVDHHTNPKSIELAFLSKEFDSAEIKKLNNSLKDFGINNTTLTIKQNTSDLKAEILNEINLQKTNTSEKDLQINVLKNELNQYKMDNPELVKEIKILFPEVDEIAVGKIQNFYTLDSTGVETAFLYKTDSKIDEPKLKSWLENKLKSNKIILVNTKTFSK
ncbi:MULTISPECIES: DUF389 domain-containing protein [Chryseobacterium]|uniref:Hydrophobic protein (TIGR00271 family) n=1 Tax=Chryseobacterium geocarposphaerae TaxID=1416776 RepID=A0ABU1LIS4_9FLAO|nr:MULTISPECIES: DUF389 domain-containing protein [Chryseobacterium]MDR6406608.1 putative hydrophobic protein (TIGR00271 family) [Chryseobacterium geocarposphaerae]MDR6700157.1 putative hydrophobic protein (TIGR00271 family) [Chryseobacterium ginsenosidimutans]